ncbi:MAG: hypothetical protein WAN23_16010 [Candidatus Acidiferrales bacterium]
MKKTIAISVCVLLGAVAGYFVAPIASIGIIQSTESDMFGAFVLYIMEGQIGCACANQPPAESANEVSKDISILEGWRTQNKVSRVLAQEIGLAKVRLSQLEMQLGRNAQADQDMKSGQKELAALGWKDVSSAHLTALVTQLNSEYSPPVRKKATTIAAH